MVTAIKGTRPHEESRQARGRGAGGVRAGTRGWKEEKEDRNSTRVWRMENRVCRLIYIRQTLGLRENRNIRGVRAQDEA